MNRRAIIADDTEDMRVLLRMVLAASGWEIEHEAANGAEAREAWLNSRDALDALVLDHNMPGLTGMALAEEVRAEDALLPILLVSAHLNEDIRARAVEIGITCIDKIDAPRLGEYLPS